MRKWICSRSVFRAKTKKKASALSLKSASRSSKAASQRNCHQGTKAHKENRDSLCLCALVANCFTRPALRQIEGEIFKEILLTFQILRREIVAHLLEFIDQLAARHFGAFAGSAVFAGHRRDDTIQALG